MQPIGNKIILGVFILLGFLIISESTQSEVLRWCYQEGFNASGDMVDRCGYRILYAMPESQLTILDNHPLVHNITVSDGQTYILLIPEAEDLVTGQEIIHYLSLYQTHNVMMEAQVIKYPDTFPAPLCVRDVTTDVVNGIYTNNNQIFIQVNDSRCPI